MSAPVIPVHWILEYAVKHPANFKEEFIQRSFLFIHRLIFSLTRQYRIRPRTTTNPPHPNRCPCKADILYPLSTECM